MKNIKYILSAAALVLLAACAQVLEPEYVKGEPDLEGCEGLYFPEQESEGSHEIEPGTDYSLTFKAIRTNDKGILTVPVEFDGDDIFKVGELAFEDGQTESEFTVTFDGAEIGETYSAMISVTDPQVASVYADQKNYVSFSVSIAKWNLLGEATYADKYFAMDAAGTPFSVPVAIEQSDSRKNVFRFVNPYGEDPNDKVLIEVLSAGDKFPSDAPAENQVTASEGWVYYDMYSTYYENSTYEAIVWITHPALFQDGDCSFNRVVDWQDNGLPGIISIAPFYYMNGVGGFDYSTESQQISITFPDYVSRDYSVKVSVGVSAEGKIPVMATFGKDIAKVDYAVFGGELSASDIATMAEDVKNRKEGLEIGSFVSGEAVALDLSATGQYTLVTANYDAGDTYQGYTSKVFEYLAAGDESPVVATLDLMVHNKDAANGNTSDNSAEWFLIGQDLKEVYLSIEKTSTIQGATAAELVAYLKARGKKLSEDEVKSASGAGVGGTYTKLLPGTPYTLLAYVTNGYEDTLLSASVTTTGDPDPIYNLGFTIDDIPETVVPKSDFLKTWDLYAIPQIQNAPTSRVKLGQVSIEEAEDITYEGVTYDMVTLKNLFGAFKLGDFSFTLEYSGGIVAISTETFPDSPVAYDGLGDIYMSNYCTTYGTTSLKGGFLVGGFVEDGYMAFVAHPASVAQGNNFTGMALAGFMDPEYKQFSGYTFGGFDYILLVDPALDSEETQETASVAVKNHADYVANGPKNYVELNALDLPSRGKTTTVRAQAPRSVSFTATPGSYVFLQDNQAQLSSYKLKADFAR